MRTTICLLIGIVALSACAPQAPKDDKNRLVDLHALVPATFDSLPEIPDDNILTTARVELGKHLFFEKRLSYDGSISCGSCHVKTNAYADNKAKTRGVHGRTSQRNVPTLINVAYQQRLFMEGGVKSLEAQIISPFLNENEMNFSVNKALARIRTDSAYIDLAMAAYGDTLDAYMIARAIASYERTLLSTGSKYDDYISGDSTALSTEAVRGMKIFFSDRAKCSSCHSGFLFTDQQYYNIGLDTVNTDEGRGRITLDSTDIGKFKTPSLRNISLTAPYMHDGSMRTLPEVIQHYNTGGKSNRNKDPRIDSLGLSQAEINALVLFLNSLTDRRMPG